MVVASFGVSCNDNAPQTPEPRADLGLSTCNNGQQDPDEQGIDCGGPCPGCPDPCSDGIVNDRETDVDCGGATCPRCAVGEQCRIDADCRSMRCADLTCQAAPTCADEMQNASETDVDCGGPACESCDDGRRCQQNSDCLSGRCVEETCRAPSCDDGQKNRDESDIDCGGAFCSPCADGLTCADGDDCGSGRCEETVCVSCTDGRQNGGESDVDCGGSCPGCPDGASCIAPSDCASQGCEDGRCISCQDGMRNGTETDVDCGGGCSVCISGQKCAAPSDCASQRCEDGRCRDCSDLIQSGLESDIDCGGPCAGCVDGSQCRDANDCQSLYCPEGRCVSCPVGQHACANRCVSNFDVATCGTACTPCPAPNNGVATCDGTTCGIRCNPGFNACGNNCFSNNDPSRCGPSCTRCTAPSNGTPRCIAGACNWDCNAGLIVCGFSCRTNNCPYARLTLPRSRSGARFEDAAARFDGTGHLHVVGAETLALQPYRLVYSVYDGTGWTTNASIQFGGGGASATEVITGVSIDTGPSATVASFDLSGPAATGRLATWTGSGWQVQTIAESRQSNGVRLDSLGDPWTAFRHINDGRPHVARLTSTGWEPEAAAAQSSDLSHLERGPSGQLSMLQYATVGGLREYRYARRAGSWSAEPLGRFARAALAEGPFGTSHFVATSTNGIQYRSRVGGAWGRLETVEPAVGAAVATTATHNGRPVVGATFRTPSGTYALWTYQRRPDGTWVSQRIDVVTEPTIVMTADDAGRIAIVVPGAMPVVFLSQ